MFGLNYKSMIKKNVDEFHLNDTQCIWINIQYDAINALKIPNDVSYFKAKEFDFNFHFYGSTLYCVEQHGK